MFHLLFDSSVDGPDDPGQIAGAYQLIADTNGPQTGQTPARIILHCEDMLFDQLVAHGVHPGFDDDGDPCADPATKSVIAALSHMSVLTLNSGYGFRVADLQNEEDREKFGDLVGDHIVLCTSFLLVTSVP
jgi:hypothetical protein